MLESRLPEIAIVINGITYENTFARDVLIDRTDLETEFARQPETYAYYAFLAEDAKALYERAKAELEQQYARLDHEKRTNAAAISAQNPKFKLTEKMVENEVITDPRYITSQTAMLDAKLLAGQLQQAATAIAQRRDMLQQMGANSRIGMMPARVLEHQQESAHEIIAANRAAQKQAIAAAQAAPPTEPTQPAEEPSRAPRRRRQPRTV